MSVEVLTLISTILVILLAVAPVPALTSTYYLWSVYRSDPARPRSWLLRMLVAMAMMMTGVTIYVGIVVIFRLLNGAVPEVFIFGVAVMLLALAGTPIYGALRVYRAAHGGASPTIPSMDPSDRTKTLAHDARDVASTLVDKRKKEQR